MQFPISRARGREKVSRSSSAPILIIPGRKPRPIRRAFATSRRPIPWRDKTAALLGAALHLQSPITKRDRKSTRLNSSHSQISYAVFCLKKKKLEGLVGRTRCGVSTSHSPPLIDLTYSGRDTRLRC